MAGDTVDEFLRLLNPAGKEIYSSDQTHWKNLNTDIDIVKRFTAPDAKPLLLSAEFESQEHTTRMIYGYLGPGVILHLGDSLEEKEEIMELLLIVFAIMLCFVIPMAYGVGRFVAKKAVRGIDAVSRAAIDIERGKFNQRVSVAGSGYEIETLANTFNDMAKRIRGLIAEMREMIDNIAHDLRSPLGRIRAISESVLSASDNGKEYKKAAADTLEECDRLIQLINTTLDVAEAESGVANNISEDVDISQLTEDACELFEPVAEEKEITLLSRIEPSCWLRGNKHNLQRMLANLLDNAVKYTAVKGRVTISLVRNKDNFQIDITDTGMGVPLTDQHRVFQRFFRCDQSRSQEGCGLGLSFARAVARTHGGDIKLTSTPTEGSTFTVSLPA
jgi:signal transduction histidine kinase